MEKQRLDLSMIHTTRQLGMYDTRKMFLCAYCYSYRMMRAVQAYLGQHGGPNMGPRPTVSLQKLQKITQPTRED